MLVLQRIPFNRRIIDRYVTEEKGIRGVLKDTCDDFIVQEITKEGVVVELKNTEVPDGIS